MPVTIQKSKYPVCSVCIANYNGESFLRDCLESVLAQEGDFDLEIIVHDDASTDTSLALLKNSYPSVRVIESRENVGFCISNNRMVNQAHGEHILLLNNDAALFPDALATLLAAAKIQKTPGIIGLPQYDWNTGELVDRGCLLDPFYYPIPNLDPHQRDVAYVVGACLWAQRTLWHELGGFPEWMGSVAEDLYLGCRARLSGAPVQVLDRSGYRHRQGATLGGSKASGNRLRTTYRRRFLSERNKTAVMIICTPTPAVWLLLSGHLLALGLEGLIMSLVRLDGKLLKTVYGRAVLWLIQHPGMLLRMRKQVQKRATIGLRTYMHMHVWRLRKASLLLRHGIPHIR